MASIRKVRLPHAKAEDIRCCLNCGGDLTGQQRKFCGQPCAYNDYGLKVGRLKYVKFDPAQPKGFFETQEETAARRARLLEKIRRNHEAQRG